MLPFHAKNREQCIQSLAKKPLDLLIIGGGVTGAGIALDAQTRGLHTGLIDMQDFAAGTSSRSTKLVHGGLRYLKQLHFKLVAEVGRERAIVYNNAPHVTTPLWMMLPIYKNGSFGTFSTSIGLWLYDVLAQVKASERRNMLDRKSTLAKEPLLKQAGLKGSGYYVEYRTDDARLTLEIIKEAVHKGALAVNYLKAVSPLYEQRKLIGFEVVDQLTGKQYKIYAHKIVNAAGPWVDNIRETDQSKQGKYLHLTKGVHLVVSKQRFPLNEAIYFDTPFHDGRMMFAIPRDGKTYIGTTDTHYTQDKTNPKVTPEDMSYILDAVNSMFDGLQLTKQDIESSWAGLRPLIHEEGKDPSDISRKDELFISDSGLISIAGGKLTGYRKMAEKVVDIVSQQLREETGRTFQACTTEHVTLSGGHMKAEYFAHFVDEQARLGEHIGFTYDQAAKLARRYGSNITTVYEIAQSNEALVEGTQMDLEVFAALLYSIEHEMTAAPVDFFIRRTSSLYFDIDWVQRWKAPVIQFMAQYFGWTKEQTAGYTEQLELAIVTAAETFTEA